MAREVSSGVDEPRPYTHFVGACLAHARGARTGFLSAIS